MHRWSERQRARLRFNRKKHRLHSVCFILKAKRGENKDITSKTQEHNKEHIPSVPLHIYFASLSPLARLSFVFVCPFENKENHWPIAFVGPRANRNQGSASPEKCFFLVSLLFWFRAERKKETRRGIQKSNVCSPRKKKLAFARTTQGLHFSA